MRVATSNANCKRSGLTTVGCTDAGVMVIVLLLHVMAVVLHALPNDAPGMVYPFSASTLLPISVWISGATWGVSGVKDFMPLLTMSAVNKDA